MGYGIQAYAVNEEQLDAVWASNDEGVIDRALATSLGAYRSRSDSRLRELLGAIVRGTAPVGNTVDAHDYLYAMEVLCALYGTRAEGEIRLSPKGIDRTPEMRLFLRSSPPFARWRSRDFPVVCAWGKAQVEERLASQQSWPAALDFEREIYLSWLRFAAERKLSLVGFYY